MIKITESLTGFQNDPKVSEADIKNLADRILTAFRQKQAAEIPAKARDSRNPTTEV